MSTISKFTPQEFSARVTEGTDVATMARERDHFMYHLRRMGSANLPRTATVGMGWSARDLAAAAMSLGEAIERAAEAIAQAAESIGDLPMEASHGGAHSHLVGEDGVVHAGGSHSHAFLWDGMMVFTDMGGEHTHPDGPDGVTGDESAHGHFATLPGGRTIEFSAGAPHAHEKLVGSTTFSGAHEHSTDYDGATITTLSPQAILELFSTVEAVAFSAEVAEAVGVGFVPTGRRTWEEWWDLGRGAPKVREFLAQAVGFNPEAHEAAKRASEEVIDLVSHRAAPAEGRALEAAGDRRWRVVVMRAGISRNGNFWDADVLQRDVVGALEGAPLEAIKFDPRGLRYGHSPFHPEELKAGLVANGVGQLVGVTFDPSQDGNRPTEEEAAAIARKKGWTVEEVYRKSQGAVVALAHLDKDAAWLQEKLESADERGTLAQYLGLSVDFAEAPFTRVVVPGRERHLMVRDSVNGNASTLVDFVTRPSAGGAVLAAA